jgi:hypothetical protein
MITVFSLHPHFSLCPHFSLHPHFSLFSHALADAAVSAATKNTSTKMLIVFLNIPICIHSSILYDFKNVGPLPSIPLQGHIQQLNISQLIIQIYFWKIYGIGKFYSRFGAERLHAYENDLKLHQQIVRTKGRL